MISPHPVDARRILLVAPPSEIAYVHAIFEGYDDLAVMRTIVPDRALIEVYVSPGAEEEFAALVAALRDEGVPLREAGEDEAPAPTGSTPGAAL